MCINSIIYHSDFTGQIDSGPNPGITWAFKKFAVTVIIDILLVQKRLLSIYSYQATNLQYDVNELVRLKQNYTVALSEFEVIDLAQYGSVKDIIKHGQDLFRINDYRRFFNIGLDNVEGLIRAAELDRRSKRERLVKILTTLVAAIFTFSAANQLISIIKSWSPSPSNNYGEAVRIIYSIIVIFIQQHPVISTITLYILVVSITIIVTWYGSLENWQKRRKVIELTKPSKLHQTTISPITPRIIGPYDKQDNLENDWTPPDDKQHI